MPCGALAILYLLTPSWYGLPITALRRNWESRGLVLVCFHRRFKCFGGLLFYLGHRQIGLYRYPVECHHLDCLGNLPCVAFYKNKRQWESKKRVCHNQ